MREQYLADRLPGETAEQWIERKKSRRCDRMCGTMAMVGRACASVLRGVGLGIMFVGTNNRKIRLVLCKAQTRRKNNNIIIRC